jgi:hypothetical protein
MAVDGGLIVAAAGLGLAYSAAPGAVNTEALRQFVGAGLLRWIGALSGLALGYFGLRLVWETVTTVLERPSALVGCLRRALELAYGEPRGAAGDGVRGRGWDLVITEA